VLVVTRFTVAEAQGDDFAERARAVVDTLGRQAGFLSGRLGRATDDPTAWVLVTEWASVGSYRRGISAYDVKVAATPLLASAHDEPSGFEVLYDFATGAAQSDRSPG
jgi:heme-degrading monooxygenase HmoA